MQKWIRARAAATAIVLMASPAAAQIDQLDPQFRADIERLMEMTGSLAMGQQMAAIGSDQMLAAMRKAQPNIPEAAIKVVQEVFQSELSKMFSGPDSVRPEMVALYAKHFTHDDVRALIEFYSSPVGQKAVKALPQLTRAGAEIGQRWANANMPRVVSQIEQRLRAEGLVK